MKRILFCSPVPLDPRLGMGKHWMELADSFPRAGVGGPRRRAERDRRRPDSE